MNATQNAKLGRTCTKRDGEDTRAHTHTHTHTHKRTHLQTGKLQLVYNKRKKRKKKTANTIQKIKKNKLQKKLVLRFPALFIDWNFSCFAKA